MKWKRKSKPKNYKLEWHKWFAWYPIIIFGTTDYYVWFEYVERKCSINTDKDNIFVYDRQYRMIKNDKEEKT